MSFLDELKERNREEEYVVFLKKQKEREKDEAYLNNKTRIDEKIQTIVSYVAEVNQVSPNKITVRQDESYRLTLLGERGMTLFFQGNNVEITFTRYEEQTEDRTGTLSSQLYDITSEKIDSWLRFVTGYGDAPIKLQSSTGRKDTKTLKIVGLIFLLLIGVVYCLEYLYPFRPSY
jgi:preprotein translocase subunit YajC